MDIALNPADGTFAAPPKRNRYRRHLLWSGGSILGLIILFSTIGSPSYRSVSLSWDPNPEADIAGYKLRYGTASGIYDQTLDVGQKTSVTISNLSHSTAYYLVVSAYNTAAQEGPPSDELFLPPNDTDLSSLSLSAGTLTPRFASATVNYTAGAPFGTSSLFIVPALADGTATMKVNGVPASTGAASANVALTAGSTILTIVVTSPDQLRTKTYTVAVTLLTPLETWRQTYFGITGNTGSAANTATPQNDGITNLMKFATAMDPTRPGKNPGTLSQAPDGLRFTYTRNKAALTAGLIFAVEWKDSLNGATWSGLGVAQSVVDQGATDLVTAVVPAGTAGHRFVRLKVTAP